MYSIKQSSTSEAETLLQIQKACIHSDYLLYRDSETSPYTQSLEELEKDISGDSHYTIFEGEKVVGAVVLKTKENRAHIYKMFIDAAYQNTGIGQRIMKEIFNKYNTYSLWTVYTPFKSYRNHHFYEKLGFVKYGEARESDDLVLFKYRRVDS